MEAHEYESIRQMQGSMSYRAVARPGRVRAGQLHEGAELLCAPDGTLSGPASERGSA